MSLAAASLQAEDWKLFGFDLKHSSFNPTESSITIANIGRLRPVWTTSLGAPLAAAATLVDGTLYVGAWDGNFYAIKASDGTILWKQFTGMVPAPSDPACFPVIGVSSQATVVGDNVYVGGGDSAVYAFERATGRLLWREEIADPSTGAYLWSSISAYRNALYIGVASLGDCPLARGALVRIDLDHPDTAQIKYLAPVGEIGAGIWSTPAIDAKTDTVFVTTGTGDQDADAGMWGASMLSLDAGTLEIKMFFVLPTSSIEEDIEWGSSPTLFEDSSGLELVGATGKDGVLYVRKRQDLTPVWQTKLAVQCPSPQDGCGAISTPAFDGARLYVGAGAAVDAFGSGSLYALDPATGDVIWRATMEGTVLAPVTVAGGLVFAATTLGMAVYGAGTGEAVWADPRPGALYSQPVVADGMLYTTYVNGDVVGWRIGDLAANAGSRPGGRLRTRRSAPLSRL